MKNLLLLSVSIVLTACTLSPTGTLTGSTQRYETHNDILNTWVGKSEQELQTHWGVPVRTQSESNNTKIIYFRSQNPYIYMACINAFQIEKGVVTKWGTRGCPVRDNKKDYKLVHKDAPVPQPTLDISGINLGS
ncbi:hypothetical protein [Acinetobacter rudis]|uniref:Uncharacterized protein n=1 Tax=Acinetobacter rudis TaxID=632955 RepID=A0AAW8JDH5_9GAMM|nr:hypothetical protein [Acinetobacter rudis]MDQ8937244.1 hypothetical protein [Acinetobacter rudis]MDQ8952420.1 hypothetical protein [Acinetobacter rudis]MDQ9019448.1 hypothetical protein [Acinetobacter rudis]